MKVSRLSSLAAAVLFSGCFGVVGDPPEADAGGTPESDAGAISEPDAGMFDAGTPTGDAGSDAGPSDAGTFDAGVDLLPVFVAVGKQGRRAVSCDDGRTWKNDVSVDDAWPVNERYRCFSGDFTLPDGGTQSTDCDHNAYSSTSLVAADGAFIQSLGWGAPGSFWRSTDAVSWQQVHLGANVTDVMFGNGKLLTATRSALRSSDLGLTWTSAPEIPVANGATPIWNVRGGTFGGGTFLVTAQDGSNLDFAFSSNDGATWQRPTMQGGGRVDICGAGHPVWGNGLFVTLSWSQSLNGTVVCRSTDGAATWTSTVIAGESIDARPVWTGTEFLAWSSGKVHRSADGANWTSTPTQTRVAGCSAQVPAWARWRATPRAPSWRSGAGGRSGTSRSAGTAAATASSGTSWAPPTPCAVTPSPR